MDRSVDVAVVGAGFAGMYMVYKCRQAGLSVQVFEAGTDVGGTWYWNRYPGARCDVESVEYSYSFDEALQQEWEWTERYAAQPEILKYAQHVADRFDIRRDVQFNTKVTSAHFNEFTNTWTTSTDTGDTVISRFLVMATGCLSSANTPHFEGAEVFAGEVYHTGEWPHDGVDFTGKSVGLIGTGSSAIQSIPLIAQDAQHLTVFQRTASYSVPARNDSIDADYVRQVKADYKTFRDRNREQTSAFGSNTPKGTTSVLSASEEERHREFEERWQRGGFGFLSSYSDFLLNPDANEVVADFVRNKIREIVKDPVTAEKLMPTQVIGCKRLCLDSGYYDTFNRDNVSLVDVSETPIKRLTPHGLVVGETEHTFDALVYATGFDAMTGSILKVDIRGRHAQPLSEAWEAGPLTYLGLCVAGFPNMFMVSGPGSPSVLTNMIMSIEQHVEWITECITNLSRNGYSVIETTEQSQQNWVAYVNAVAESTLYPSCNSWYLGANVPGKPRVFMPLIGFPAYVQKCNEVACNNYEGFVLH
jgi:cation diffusion facilitator CzcD-associated flavoprotein CzcO